MDRTLTLPISKVAQGLPVERDRQSSALDPPERQTLGGSRYRSRRKSHSAVTDTWTGTVSLPLPWI